MSESEAIIIGAGPAGLTAAYELSKLGVHSTVLEADNLVGGISRTVCFDGYRFDIGGHRFFSKVPLINELWDEILGEEFLIRPRMSRIFYRGHYFDYPLKAGNALSGLGPVEAVLILLSYMKAKVYRSPEEATFEQWVSNRFGYRLYTIFFKTYTEKVWGIPCKEISADWAAQRIKNLSLLEALRGALLGSGRSRKGEVITTLIDEFKYPRLGPGMMWEQCEKILDARGNPTKRGVSIERLRHHKGQVECVYGRSSSGDVDEYAGSHFISSMPLRELMHSLDPLPPPEVLHAADKLRYRDYLTVVLIVNREHVFPDNWIYIHSPEVKMGRIQNYKNWSPEMVPDASTTSLGLEYFLWETDEEWSWPDERLIELGIRECAQLGMVEPSEVIKGTVVRMKKAYPVYDHQYQQAVETIRRYLDGFSNLQTVGRNGMHRYNNQDHSMLTAVYAARNMVGSEYDIWSVNVEKEYHEETRAPAPEDRAVPMRVTVPEEVEAARADELIKAAFARLDPLALGVAVGSVCGVGLFLATALLVVKGGPVVGPNLSLLGNYLLGFKATWGGAFLGLLESGVGGFGLGYGIAGLRNWGMAAYARMVKDRAEAEESRDLLDRV